MNPIFYLLMLIFATQAEAQNQFHMGQYMVHQPFVNPAAMSASNQVNAAIFYRDQWLGFEGAPTMTGLNVNMPLGERKSNFVGITVVRDQIGVNTSHQLCGSYTYKIKTGNIASLAFGMAATLHLMQSDFDQLIIRDEDDPLFQASTPTFAMPNFKFGIYFQRKRFYAGFSIPNMLENTVIYSAGVSPVTEFDFNSMHYYLHAGNGWKVGGNHMLNTSFLIKEVGGAPVQADINLQFMFNQKIGIGTSWRTSGEVLGIFTLNVLPELLLSYAYEYNYNRIGGYSAGTHELLAVYRFVPPKNTVIEVPRF